VVSTSCGRRSACKLLNNKVPLKDLHLKLQRLQGKAYGTLNDLRARTWLMGDFTWNWVHIQGDPYAPPSRLRVTVSLAHLGIPESWHDNPIRALGLADFLLRRLAFACTQHSTSLGTGNGGTLATVEPGPEILRRNSARIEQGNFVALIQVGLPADARRIESEWVIQMLCQSLPDALTEACYASNFPAIECEKFLRNLEIQRALRAELEPRGLVAFVANGSILPRASGTSDIPLRGARPFQSPKELEVAIEVMGETIRGMGIPQGITAIAGGGFHGKSTLLRSIELAVYDHVPGDGRERIVCDATASKVRAEEGRQVLGTCIEPLVRRLPGGRDTRFFMTSCASGSTSQAANLMEAIGLGAHTLLIDEDISAVNFLIRDERMRLLIPGDKEPLIPLVDRICEIRDRYKRNFILVIGACGDYLQIADTVIVMEDWEPRLATNEAHATGTLRKPDAAPGSWPAWPDKLEHSLDDIRKHLKNGTRPATAIEKGIKVKANLQRIQLGRLEAKVDNLSQFACLEQMRSVGAAAISLLLSNVTGSLEEAVAQGSATRSFPEGMDLAEARGIELGATLLRLAEME